MNNWRQRSYILGLCVNLHNSKEELVICSSYQDITFPEVINNIDKCVEHSKNVRKDIIIGADSNAHSQMWMSESANFRGEVFEDFITLNNLFICNVGNKYTYDCALDKSIIDIYHCVYTYSRENQKLDTT